MPIDVLRSPVAAANRDLNAAEIRRGRSHLSSTPLQINTDLTGICNIHPPCVFCSGKNVGYDYPPIEVTALDAYAPYLERCETVNDDSFGEPLLHPALVDVARRFIGRGQNFSFVSNGLLLSRDKARQLAELGPRLGMHVSFNAATAGTFYRLTGKSFDLLVGNVRTFVEVFREENGVSPDLILTFIVMRMNRHEVPAFLQLTADLRCRALLAPLHERPSRPLGHFGYDFVYEREMLAFAELQQVGAEARRIAERLGIRVLLQWDDAADSAVRGFAEPGVDAPCLIPFRFLHVQHHSRKVYACPYHTKPLGDLLESSVEAIWNSARAQDMRRSLLAGEVPDFCWNNSAACPIIGRSRAGRTRLPATSEIVMGETDRFALLDGWYRLEDIPEPARWTSPRASFEIAPGGKTTLCVRCQSYKPGLETDPVRGSVSIGDVALGAFALRGPGWHDLRFALPAGCPSARPGALTCTLVTSNPWVPAAVLPSSVFEAVLGRPKMIAGSRDTRELGIVVRRIWME
jgi:MoaA/NifB/PqqE/SkfB family radical SAM enzyme